MNRGRIAIIVVHGAGPYYTDPLLAAGRLPNWQRLSDEGASGLVRVHGPVLGGTWPTMLTGLEIAQHGVFDHVAIDASQFPPAGDAKSSSLDYGHETILALASAAGRSVASLGSLLTAPPFPVNGVSVPGEPLDDDVCPATWPPELGPSIAPVNLHQRSGVDYRNPGRTRQFIDHYLEHARNLAKTTLTQRDWDFFIVTFNAPDQANHYFCMNPAVSDWRSLVDEYFIRTDEAVGDVINCLPADTTILLMSDHGCRPRARLRFGVSTWLEQQGWLVRKRDLMARTAARGWFREAYRTALRVRLAERLRSFVPRSVERRLRAAARHWSLVDIGHTRIYPVELYYPLAGFEINLRGRNAQGVVAEADFEPLRHALMDALATLRLPGQDVPLFRTIERREDHTEGRFAQRFPDVIAELHPDVEADLQFGVGLFSANPGRAVYPFSGYHDPDTLMVLHGPGVPAGSRLVDASFLDVMPTAMHLLGLPVPPDRRGRNLTERVVRPTADARAGRR